MSSSSEATIAVIINTPPTADLEASELILALATFDLPVQLFFMDLGVSWLLEQQARKPQGKSAAKILAALPMYGVEQVYCSEESIALLSIKPEAINKLAKLASNKELAAKISRCRHCLTF